MGHRGSNQICQTLSTMDGTSSLSQVTYVDRESLFFDEDDAARSIASYNAVRTRKLRSYYSQVMLLTQFCLSFSL